MKKIKKIIGRRAIYKGKDHPYLKEISIYRIMRLMVPDDPESIEFLETDEEIAAAGGMKPTDRVEVQPVLEDGRLSFVTSDPHFCDLRLINSNKPKSKKETEIMTKKKTEKTKTKTAVKETATKKAVETGITLAEAIPEFLGRLTELGKNVRTVEVYGRCLENVSSFFTPDKPLTKLTPMNLGQFLKSDALLKKPNNVERSPITIKQIARVLRMFLVWAVEKNYIQNVPLPKSEMKGGKKNEADTISGDIASADSTADDTQIN